jgi:hypothetical protein
MAMALPMAYLRQRATTLFVSILIFAMLRPAGQRLE